MGLGEYYNLLRLWRWLKGGCKGMDTSKLNSRKLWMTLIGTAIVTLLTYMETPEAIVKTVATIFLTYLGGQAAVDLFRTKRDNGG